MMPCNPSARPPRRQARRRRRDEGNISGKKLFIVGHPHAQLAGEAAVDELPACDPRIETVCDVLSANAVAKAPPIRPVPITTIFSTLLLLGLVVLRRFRDQGRLAGMTMSCAIASPARVK